jgi:hypothetical protein
MTEEKTCSRCEMEFDWQGVTVDGEEYCCEGCASGGECTCPQHDHAPETPLSEQIALL